MQVSVESTGALQRRIKVELPEDQISQAVESRLQKMTHTASIKGFRKGKVPLKVVKQHYGKQIRQEVVGDLIQQTFYQAISQEKLKPAGMPSIDDMADEGGKGLVYTASFEVYPEFEVKGLAGVSLEKPTAEITDADVDDMLETIRKQHIEWQTVERAARQDDRVTVDFKGTINGEAFEGGTGTDMVLEIGQGRMIAGFEDGISGKAPGETFTLDLTFPEGYHASDLAGKPVQFEITLKKVEEPVLPEANEAFAKKLGIEGGMAKMREEIRANMTRELSAAITNKTKEAVMNALLEANPIEVPQALIDEESKNMLNQMVNNFAQQGMSREQVLSSLQPSMFDEQARRRVGLGLILAEIVKTNKIVADEAKVKAKIALIAEPYDRPEEVVSWYRGDKQRMAEIESLVLEEQVVDWAEQQANVTEKPSTFKELLNPQQSGK
ncbi:MAG: trigger factor [Gammaproteobacteria bacterium]